MPLVFFGGIFYFFGKESWRQQAREAAAAEEDAIFHI